ncbi:MAG: double zinc ribbon domain-containing protein [Actinobacteria bacterium]|nr:double zinc ribbon domain-containing protein [Actinomycetota bacterium]
MLAELLSLAVPPRCAACRAPGRRAGDVLCGACRRALPWLAAACCPRCALPLPCGPCPARAAAFDAAWSAVAYEGSARDVLHALKFAGARPLAGVMAAQIAAGAPPRLLAGAAIVAVPAHPGRRRTRGYDPAELLARALARRTGLALACPLRRGAGAVRQLGAPRAVRRAPGRLRIAAVRDAPADVLLVDDVHTTGATLDACAVALRGAGAGRVVAVTWARAL